MPQDGIYLDYNATAPVRPEAAAAVAGAHRVFTIGGAQAFLRMQAAGEDFSAFAWSFVGGVPLHGDGVTFHAQTPLSAEISKALKARAHVVFHLSEAVDVEAQLDRRRDLVDVLPAGASGADEALFEIALVDRQGGGHGNHGASVTGEPSQSFKSS